MLSVRLSRGVVSLLLHPLLACALAAWAVPAPGTLSGDPTVSEVVKAVETRYRTAKTLKATFLEVYREGGHDVRAEAGTVYFRRPGKMRWEYTSPEEKLFVADGNYAWFYVPADHTVTRAKMKESGDWHAAMALFIGRGQLSDVCGRVEMLTLRPGTSSPDGLYVAKQGNRLLRCHPKSNDAAFALALLEIDPAFRVTRVLIRERGGIETEFRFAGWSENLPLTASLFIYKAPPGVAIVNADDLIGR